MAKHPIQNLAIAYVHFYVEDLAYWQNWFQRIFNLQYCGKPEQFTHVPDGTIQLQSKDLTILLSAPQNHHDPVKDYLNNHPCGVADVAFFVEYTKDFSANTLEPLVQQVKNPVGFQHTLIVQKEITQTNHKIDHLVLNVPQGYLEATIQWYEAYFGFVRQQRFTIQTNYSGLSSQVLKHNSGIQIPINQPDNCRSQIQEFIDYNRGAGIQHIALKYENLPQQIYQFRQQGLHFLDVPKTYYENLLKTHPELQELPYWENIQIEKILVDVVKLPKEMLFQIFTQPIFKEPTFFWEFIERKEEAQGFGEGNFQALFEAIEEAQKQRILSP